uniref:Uncharacterized protein n=1 Tax=Meloidogyne enterolobii TaxID=390850 RepID=A0A6V7VEF7_MELEN|nr:unnamed protein product [Meloidogyne enterolobii]
MSLSSPIIKTQIPASSDTKTTTNNNINSQKQQNLVKNKNSNGGNFHSISLRSPANQPVVLSFEGNYYNNDTNGDVATKLRVEENRKNSSEERKSKDVVNFYPSNKNQRNAKVLVFKFCQRPLASRRFLLCLVALLSILAILLIISLVFVLLSVRWPNGEENDDVDFLNKHSSWQYSCDHKCNANFSVPPLLIISMDGFRADYLKRGITHSVSRILECGSSAQYMLPSFPSKTFPNHLLL